MSILDLFSVQWRWTNSHPITISIVKEFEEERWLKSLNIKRWTVGRLAWCQRMGRPGKDFRQVLATQTGENDGPRLVMMMIIIIILGKPSQIRWIFRDSPNGLKLLSNEDEQIIRIIIRQTDDKNDIINKKWFIPCSFRDLSVLVQPADIVSKFRKQLKNVRSHKDFLLGWSIHFFFDSYDQYIGNLIGWSIHWQFEPIATDRHVIYHRARCINKWFEWGKFLW